MKNISKIIIIIVMILFLGLYFFQVNGYSEYFQRKKVTLTNEQISKFENDLKDGKNIDIETYLENNDKDYSNNLSSISLNISKGIETTFIKCLKYVFNKLGNMVP